MDEKHNPQKGRHDLRLFRVSQAQGAVKVACERHCAKSPIKISTKPVIVPSVSLWQALVFTLARANRQKVDFR